MLRDLVADRVRPGVGAAFPPDAVPDALRHLAKGHARGKTIVTV